MDKFIISIKKKYRERLLSREEQWPPVRGDKLINLQLVEADKAEGFCGIGGGKKKRTPIAYGDLFKAEDGKKPVRKIIVEGNGGMGKTTLCTMVAEGWADGKISKEFDCVLLLPFREGKVSSAESLPDLFKLLHASEKIRSSVINDLEEREGEGVLIIADGWDELEEVKREKGSFLYSLLFDDILPFASVLLTSRPSASAPLHSLPSVDRLMEVVGFNEENVKEYIHSEFSKCPEKASSLIEQLDNNPLLHNVCSVPLNCAIICNLWHKFDQVIPSTITEMYTLITQSIIFRDIKKKFPDSLLDLENFDSIPEHLQSSFRLTCKFAFDYLLKDQIVFSKSELASFFPEVLDSNENFLCFGLLQSALSLLPVGTGHGLSFHFLHLTIQEFLAALHFVTLPSEVQQKIFQDHAKSKRFANVWKFAFGLGSKTQGSCSERVRRNVVCLEDKVVDGFVSALSGDRLLLCHCALESKDDVVTTKVARQIGGQFVVVDDENGIDSIARTPHDCVAVYHILRHTSHGSSVDIYLYGCGLGDKQLDELTDILSGCQLKVKMIFLGNSKSSNNGVTELFVRASASFSSFSFLVLRDNNINGDGLNSIVTSLMQASCKSLTWLFISDNPLGVSGMQALERAAEADMLVNLQYLALDNTLTTDADINGALLTTLLKSISSHCPCLFFLSLSGDNLGEPGSCGLAETLPLLTNLVCLVSKSCQLTNHLFTEMNTNRASLHYLYNLDLSDNNIDNDGVNALISHLPELFPTLKEVNLDDNPVTEETKMRLGECLEIYIQEREDRRWLMLCECDITHLPPQSEKLLSEFLRMWEYVLTRLCILTIFNRYEPTAESNVDETTPSSIDQQTYSIEIQHSSPPRVPPNSPSPPLRPSGLMSPNESKPSGLTSTDESQPSGLTSTDESQPSGLASTDESQPSGLTSTKPSGLTSTDESQPSGLTSTDESQPSGLTSTDESQPSGLTSTDESKPSGLTSTDESQPSGLTSTDESQPSGLTSTDESQPSGLTSTDESKPSGLTSTDESKPSGLTSTDESTHKVEQQGPEKYLNPSDLGKLLNVIYDVRSKWRNLGLALGVQPGTLDAIDKSHRGDCDDCFYYVLLTWLQSSAEVTIEGLVEALSVPSVGYVELAKKLREKY